MNITLRAIQHGPPPHDEKVHGANAPRLENPQGCQFGLRVGPSPLDGEGSVIYHTCVWIHMYLDVHIICIYIYQNQCTKKCVCVCNIYIIYVVTSRSYNILYHVSTGIVYK